MNCYAFCSPAVMPLYNLFERSVCTRTSLTLKQIQLPPEFDNCRYGEERYWRAMSWMEKRRCDIVYEEKESFVTTGCDSIFLGDPVPDFVQRLASNELLAANDYDGFVMLCGCLVVVTPNDNTRKLYDLIVSDPELGVKASDPILNRYRDTTRWSPLPRESYWNISGRLWSAGDPIPNPPPGILWYHANFTIGVSNKLHLMQTIEAKVHEKH